MNNVLKIYNMQKLEKLIINRGNKIKPRKILESLPKNLNDIEKAIYIYIELGKHCVDDNLKYTEKVDYPQIILKEISEVDEVKRYNFTNISVF